MSADPFGHEVVAGSYDRFAGTYATWADAIRPALREVYVDLLREQLEPGSRVVELGCGPGVPVAAMLAPDYDYEGIDLSAEMVRIAASNVPSGRFSVGDMRHIEYPSESLGAVVALFSIIHVPNHEHAALFARVHRWLKPGGWFLAALTSRAFEAGTEPDWLGHGPMFWSGWEPATNDQLLREAGFDLVRSEARRQVEGDVDGDIETEFHWVLCRAGAG